MKTFLRKAPKVIVFVVIVLFAYALLDVLYLFALNDRYQNVNNDQYVLDQWTGTVYDADYYDGLYVNNTQRIKHFKSPFWRFGK